MVSVHSSHGIENFTEFKASYPMPEIYNWYAVYTHSRAEKKVYQSYVEAGIEAFLPLQKKIKKWSDRKKIIDEPVIRSYVFIRVSEKEYYDALAIKGVVRYISFSGKAAVIPDWQIEMLKNAVLHKVENEVVGDNLILGDHVEICKGPFNGIRGNLIDHQGKKMFMVEISHIGRYLLLKIPAHHIKRI